MYVNFILASPNFCNHSKTKNTLSSVSIKRRRTTKKVLKSCLKYVAKNDIEILFQDIFVDEGIKWKKKNIKWWNKA